MSTNAVGGATKAAAHPPHASAKKPAAAASATTEMSVDKITTSKDAQSALKEAIAGGWFVQRSAHKARLEQLRAKGEELHSIEKAALRNSAAAASPKDDAPANATSDSGTPKVVSGTEIKPWHLILSTGVTALVATGLVFWMMEHKAKKNLAVLSQLQKENTKLKQAIQSSSDDSAGGNGTDPSNQGLALAS